MANLKSPPVDTSGATQPSAVMALVLQANIARPATIVYTGGIIPMPTASSLAPTPAVGYATTG